MDLKEMRLEKGISVRELARISGVCRRTIILIEKGNTKKPYDYTIWKLKRALEELK